MSSANVAKIAEVAVKRRAAQFSFLKDVVALKTESGSNGLAARAEKLAVALERMGFEVERHAVPIERIEARGVPAVVNLVVRMRFGDGPILALVSHVDTAPITGDWQVDPHAGLIEDGQLFGVGVLSGKGHLAAQVFSLLALKDAGLSLSGSLELHISFAGESSGGFGCKALLADGIVKPDYAIVGGPARSIGLYATGCLVMEAEVIGRAAPAFAPEKGADAMEAASHAMARLYQFRSGLKSRVSDIPGIGAPSMVIEHVEGGIAGGGVPARVVIRLDRRITPGEDPTEVEKQLTNLIGTTIAKSPGVRCRIRRRQLILPMLPSDAAKPLRAAISMPLGERFGAQPRPCGVGYDHEGQHYATVGIPTVLYGAGPDDPAGAGMYGADEHIALDDVRLATEILALAAVNLLGEG